MTPTDMHRVVSLALEYVGLPAFPEVSVGDIRSAADQALDGLLEAWEEAVGEKDSAESDLRYAESKIDDAENDAEEARKDADAIRSHIDGIEYEAKGKIMDGEDPKRVLEWVLTQVSGEEVVL